MATISGERSSGVFTWLRGSIAGGSRQRLEATGKREVARTISSGAKARLADNLMSEPLETRGELKLRPPKNHSQNACGARSCLEIFALRRGAGLLHSPSRFSRRFGLSREEHYVPTSYHLRRCPVNRSQRGPEFPSFESNSFLAA